MIAGFLITEGLRRAGRHQLRFRRRVMRSWATAAVSTVMRNPGRRVRAYQRPCRVRGGRWFCPAAQYGMIGSDRLGSAG